jgi:hypothetical protein
MGGSTSASRIKSTSASRSRWARHLIGEDTQDFLDLCRIRQGFAHFCEHLEEIRLGSAACITFKASARAVSLLSFSNFFMASGCFRIMGRPRTSAPSGKRPSPTQRQKSSPNSCCASIRREVPETVKARRRNSISFSRRWRICRCRWSGISHS